VLGLLFGDIILKAGETMQIQKVLQAARPYLAGKTVKDVVIGLSLIWVELDCGHLGISYVLRENLKAGCSIFPFGRQIIGKNAEEIAEWAVNGVDDVQRSVGIAVICAASHNLELKDANTPQTPFGVQVRESDTIGMIGFIPPVAKMLGPKAKDMIIFDMGITLMGGMKGQVCPMEKQPELLPKCDIVVLSGTTLINGTFDELLQMCPNSREIMVIGSSTPMFPEAFKGSGVTVLAGSWWKREYKEELFKLISLAAGMDALGQYSIKKSPRIEVE
jgi:hypothetical protein